MSATEPSDPRIRLARPDRFSHPGEVVDSLVLAQDVKFQILHQWLADERSLSVAENEGMQGGRPSQIDLVLEALRSLREN